MDVNVPHTAKRPAGTAHMLPQRSHTMALARRSTGPQMRLVRSHVSRQYKSQERQQRQIMQDNKTQKTMRMGGWALAVIFLNMTVAGAWLHYSPIPFWDMWNGYIDFGNRLISGEPGIYFAQHNEHRIALSRVLFFIDLRYFNGDSSFLIATNLILLLATALTVARVAAHYNFQKRPSTLPTLLFAWLLAWAQHENITWAFQSQFILAQLLPLWGLLALHKSSEQAQGGAFLLLACLLGISSAGTMANGVLALPVMTFYAVASGQALRRSALLAALSVLTAVAYFAYFKQPAHHSGGLVGAIREGKVAELLQYVCLYLGNPISFFFKGSQQAESIATICGGGILAMALFTAAKAAQHPKAHPMATLLVCYLGFLALTSVITAGGRISFGISQASSSRYATPALLFWAITILATMITSSTGAQSALEKLTLGLVLIALPSQIMAGKGAKDVDFSRHVNLLSVTLNTGDSERAAQLFGNEQALREIAERANHNHLSVFALPPLDGSMDLIGKPSGISARELPACVPSSYTFQAYKGGDRYYRFSTTFRASERRPFRISRILMLDEQGVVWGVGLTAPRRGRTPDFNHSPEIGVAGYLAISAAHQPLKAWLEAEQCVQDLQASLPPPIYIKDRPEVSSPGQASTAQIISNTMRGTDWGKSVIPGYQVVGSFQTSDHDEGLIRLTLKRGDNLLFRTGPSTDGIQMRFPGTPQRSMGLAPQSEWASMSFSSRELPETFTFEMEDRGQGHGQWVAVALKQKP
jgi:hypothetical protein